MKLARDNIDHEAPVPILKISPNAFVLLVVAAEIFASTMSKTCIKSLSCKPSHTIVIGCLFLNCFKNNPTTGEYCPVVGALSPYTLKYLNEIVFN